eukprot:SAG31_NODE_17611_length_664_cov_1.396460_1_plen_109_part_01
MCSRHLLGRGPSELNSGVNAVTYGRTRQSIQVPRRHEQHPTVALLAGWVVDSTEQVRVGHWMAISQLEYSIHLLEHCKPTKCEASKQTHNETNQHAAQEHFLSPKTESP